MTSRCLLPGFTFTQTALRTYLHCPHQFRLRYIEQVPWPALALDPGVEAAMARGRRFHELACQHFLGLEVAAPAGAADAEVAAWWQAFAAAPPDLSAYPHRYPEAGLSIPMGDFRLAARYDLLAVGESAARIVDWKTGAPLPPLHILADDIQTRVYLLVLAEGDSAYRVGRPLPPESLSLLYWHVAGPCQVLLPYSAARRDEDRTFIQALVEEIVARPREEMRPVDDPAACGRCAYAPLCGRPGGHVPEWEEEVPFAEAETWPME